MAEFKADGSIIMFPAYKTDDGISSERAGMIVFVDGRGFEFFVKEKESSKGGMYYAGIMRRAKRDKDDEVEAVAYINMVPASGEGKAVLTVFIKSIPEGDDEEPTLLYIGSLFPGSIRGLTRGSLNKPKEQEQKKKSSKKKADSYDDILY